MAVSPHHCSLKDFILLVSCALLLLADPVCLADPLPAPALIRQTPQGGGGLLCRAPDGHTGVLFRLFRLHAHVDEVEFPQERQEARFSLREGAGPAEYHCCMYWDRHRVSSGYSPYMRPSDPPPTPSLLVEPRGGRVVRGQSLSFRCSAPPAQSPAPQAFFLLRTGPEAEGSRVSLRCPWSLRLPAAWAQRGPFHMGPVRGGEGGSYTCVYQVFLPGIGHANSTASRPVHITVSGTDVVPSAASPPSSGAPDWPLVAGCVSAVLLFLVVLVGLGVGMQRRVKALAEKKKKREEAQFWTHLHAMDHNLDLTLRPISIGSQEWGPSSTASLGTSSRSATQCPLYI